MGVATLGFTRTWTKHKSLKTHSPFFVFESVPGPSLPPLHFGARFCGNGVARRSLHRETRVDSLCFGSHGGGHCFRHCELPRFPSRRGALLNDANALPGLAAVEERFPLAELHQKKSPDQENKDGSETKDDDEDDDDDDANDQDDDNDDEDFSGGEEGDKSDPEDDPETNGDGGAGGDGDNGDEDDDDDNEDDDDDDEDEGEDDEEETPQPPAKKRK